MKGPGAREPEEADNPGFQVLCGLLEGGHHQNGKIGGGGSLLGPGGGMGDRVLGLVVSHTISLMGPKLLGYWDGLGAGGGGREAPFLIGLLSHWCLWLMGRGQARKGVAWWFRANRGKRGASMGWPGEQTGFKGRQDLQAAEWGACG